MMRAQPQLLALREDPRPVAGSMHAIHHVRGVFAATSKNILHLRCRNCNATQPALAHTPHGIDRDPDFAVVGIKSWVHDTETLV